MTLSMDESGDVQVVLTAQEAKGLRMVVRWGCPDPMPPEIASAVRKLGDAELIAEGRRNG